MKIIADANMTDVARVFAPLGEVHVVEGRTIGPDTVLPVTAGARAISLNQYDNTSIAAFTDTIL